MFDVLSKPKVSELQKMKLFAGVPRETIEQIIESFVVRRLKSKEVLLVPDQPNQYLYLVLSGRLCVYLDSTLEEPVCSFGHGEPIGELSIIDRHTTSAYVVADKDSRLLVLEETQVWSLVKESHAFSCNLLQSLSERLRKANQFIAGKKRVEDSFYDYGMVDILTGMHSRSWFDLMIGRALRRCILQGRSFSLLMTDIDHFKSFNDRHGRMAGDLALNAIARSVQRNLRATELAVRYEGNRLVVMLPETDLHQARNVAERLRQAVLYTDIPAPGGRKLPPLTISVGIAQATAEQSLEEFMEVVLVALDRAKEMGRNFVSD